MKLKNRYALITGANQGLGEHIARRFVREGAHVLLCARSENLLKAVADSLLSEFGDRQKILFKAADVTNERQIDDLTSLAEKNFPHLDILVNCAGIAGPRGFLDTLDWKKWKEAIDINLCGTVYPCRTVLPLMKKKKYGKIINLSGGGATKPLPGLSAYAAAKAGLVRFTETLAEEMKSWNIDVNAVAPGILNTKLVDEFLEVGEAQLGKNYIEEVERQKKDSQPAFDQASALCVYLASAESDGITGKLISAVWDPWKTLHEHLNDLKSTDIYALRRIVPQDRQKTWGSNQA